MLEQSGGWSLQRGTQGRGMHVAKPGQRESDRLAMEGCKKLWDAPRDPKFLVCVAISQSACPPGRLPICFSACLSLPAARL